MEQQLSAGLGEGQIAEVVEDDEVEAGEMIGDACPADPRGPRPRVGRRSMSYPVGARPVSTPHRECPHSRAKLGAVDCVGFNRGERFEVECWSR